MAQSHRLLSSRGNGVLALAAVAALAGVMVSKASAQTAGNRVLGVDVSDWQQEDSQGNQLAPIDWNLVHKPVSQGGGGKDFAFIRSSRGGTTGTFNKYTRAGTLSHRYDDYRFQENMTNATAAGVLAGPYHFARPDIVANWPVPGQIPNDPVDEANHFIEQAGMYMKPGYLLPVLDLEAGQPAANGTPGRTGAELSQFAVAFANRIREAKGFSPLIYINQNYANYIDASVPAAMPHLWLARWPNQADPGAIDVQNGNPPPSPSTANVHGKWNPDYPQIPNEKPWPGPQPWDFWQYASTGKNIPGLLGDAGGNTDLNVAHGDIEYVKDFLVPALWTKNTSGDWATISNWNTDADPSGLGPAARLPNADDNIVLERAAADVTVSITSGSRAVRKLATFERLDINGGSLTVGRSADIHSAVNLNSGFLQVPALTTHAGAAVNINDGQLRADSIDVRGGSINVAEGGQKTLRAKSVNVSNGGKLNLNEHKLIVDYAPGSSSPKGVWTGSGYTGIEGAIASAHNDGNWNGPGITTTHDYAYKGMKTLAVAEAASALNLTGSQTTQWQGQTVDATSVLVLYTWSGDANLDSMVSGDDYSLIDFYLLVPGSRGYARGDFNYDGAISGDDYSVIDHGYAAQFGAAAGLPSAGASSAAAAASIGVTPVPEPAAASSAIFISFTALATTARRRRPATTPHAPSC